MVIEVRQFDQYVVKVDGSGRVTIRNRKFLRKYVPFQPVPPKLTITHDLGLKSWPATPVRPTLPATPRASLPDPADVPSSQTPLHGTKTPPPQPSHAPSSPAPAASQPNTASDTGSGPSPTRSHPASPHAATALQPHSSAVDPSTPLEAPEQQIPTPVVLPHGGTTRYGRVPRPPIWHKDYAMNNNS